MLAMRARVVEWAVALTARVVIVLDLVRDLDSEDRRVWRLQIMISYPGGQLLSIS